MALKCGLEKKTMNSGEISRFEKKKEFERTNMNKRKNHNQKHNKTSKDNTWIIKLFDCTARYGRCMES